MEDVQHDELESEIQVITIVLDPSNPAPQVDLGKVHPVWALSVLKQIVDALDMVSPEPDITYDNVVIYTGNYDFLGDDDDE
jgi:hypothetical protein